MTISRSGCSPPAKTLFRSRARNRLEWLFALPLRVLGRHCLHPIEGKGELNIVGLLGPQRAVIIKGGDALFRCDIVYAASLRDARDEVHDRLLRRAIVQEGKGSSVSAKSHCDSGILSSYSSIQADGLLTEHRLQFNGVSPHRRPRVGCQS